jgi:hypothetical protein
MAEERSHLQVESAALHIYGSTLEIDGNHEIYGRR